MKRLSSLRALEWRSSTDSGSTTTAARSETGSTKPSEISSGHLREQEGSQEKRCGVGIAAQLGLLARGMRNSRVKTSPAAPYPDELSSVPRKPGHLGTGVCMAGGVALHLKLGKPGHSPVWDSLVPMIQESLREDAVVCTRQVGTCCLGDHGGGEADPRSSSRFAVK